MRGKRDRWSSNGRTNGRCFGGVAHGFVLWSETGAFEHHLTCLGGCFQSSGLSPVAIAGRVKLMLQGSSAIAQGIAI